MLQRFGLDIFGRVLDGRGLGRTGEPGYMEPWDGMGARTEVSAEVLTAGAALVGSPTGTVVVVEAVGQKGHITFVMLSPKFPGSATSWK